MSTWWLVNVQLPKRKRIRKPEMIMKFPFDSKKSEHKKPQTAEEMKQTMKLIAAVTKNNKSRHPSKRRKQ